MTDLERMVALEEIKLLKARRDRACDTKDWDLYLSLHAPDHISHNEGLPRWESAAVMIEAVKQALPAGKISAHHSHTPEITFESATKARGIWAMEDNIYWTENGEECWLHGYGFYHETYEKRDGRWLFTSRQLKRTLVRTSADAKERARA
jgi:hypothetical protein